MTDFTLNKKEFTKGTVKATGQCSFLETPFPYKSIDVSLSLALSLPFVFLFQEIATG